MPENTANYMVAEEYLSSADDRFVETLLTLHDPKRLASLADKWKRDHRPKVRAWVGEYVDLATKAHGHEPVIKRLFKNAEEKKDEELLAVFVVAFDRLVRRIVRRKHRWDSGSRTSYTTQYLHTPRNRLIAPTTHEYKIARGPNKGKMQSYEVPGSGEVLFSIHTRYYLRRRVWRYYRRMGFKSPGKYASAIARALLRYTDADFAKGENFLDNWTMMHACFGESDVIEFTSSSIRLRPEKSLAELSAAPTFPQLWVDKSAAEVLLGLVSNAGARAVRVWALQLLRAHHLASLADVPVDYLLDLLESPDPDVQLLGAQLLENSKLLATLPMETWLRLLQIKSLTALEIVSRLMRQHIPPDRFSFEQAIELALVSPAPVARLGLEILRQKKLGADEIDSLTRLADMKSAAVAFDAGKWALSILGRAENYSAERASRFFDSLQAGSRLAAWEWLMADSPGYDDPVLWGRILETPFDDLRLKIIEELKRRSTLPGSDRNSLAQLWSSVLLGIHRGGRAKLAAMRQISEALLRRPDDAETLLPVLAIAIRSVRLPEARGGLSAIVRAVDQRPDIAPLVEKFLPELQLPAMEVTA